jgi:hypothetical protein
MRVVEVGNLGLARRCAGNHNIFILLLSTVAVRQPGEQEIINAAEFTGNTIPWHRLSFVSEGAASC